MENRSWRQPVTTWFRGQNQLWVEGEPDRLFDWISDRDADWVKEERDRWIRIREQQRERGIRPVKGETRIRVCREKKDGVGIQMRVVVHQRQLYGLSGRLYEQEEINGYDLDLIEGEDGWAITGCRQVEKMDTGSDQGWTYYQSPDKGEVAGSGYNRLQAVQYAETWWNGSNPRYQKFEDNCTNYISQCIHAGGIPMDYSSRRDRGWWYRGGWENWSYSWAVAHALQGYLSGGGIMKARSVGSPQDLQPGDIICYDFDGNGRWEHNTIVTALDASGMPLVNAHTVNSRRRYWDYRDSHAWTPRCKYRYYRLEG
jgi:hypothetical protein